MKARVLPLNSDEHRIVQELLPWFVNGTLEAAEAAQVTEHLAQCMLCEADAATQAQLRAMHAEASSPSGDADLGWAVLRGRLDPRSHEVARGDAMARSWWRSGLQLALAVQTAVMLVLAGALFSVLSSAEPFRALGTSPVAEANALAVFRADATQAQMSTALRAAGARIVGGPTITEAYLLHLPDAAPATLSRLRAQPGVLSVESLQGEAAR